MIQVVALATGVAGVVVAPRRIPAWAVATAVAAVAVVTGIVPLSAFDDALTNLGPPLAFLVLAVPLAVLLDELGFFATGRHARRRRPPLAPRARGCSPPW